MLYDPLAIVGRELVAVCNDYRVDAKLKHAILNAVNIARSETGNTTWYIQKRDIVSENVFSYWDNVYAIQVKYKEIDKKQAYTLIAEELTSITGNIVGTGRVADILLKRELKEKKLQKQLGLFSEYNEDINSDINDGDYSN